MPKASGQHPHNKLTAAFVKTVTAPGLYADGNCLYLFVDTSGAKRWIARLQINGRRRDMGLGGVGYVSLAKAREEARSAREMARRGEDPIEARKRLSAASMTFEQAARRVYEARKPSWENPKHAAQWITSLETHAFPLIGGHAVASISRADVLRVLEPIWLTKAETAKRVRQRLKTVFDWAKGNGVYFGDNPVEGIEASLPSKRVRQKHHEAIEYSEISAFVERLRAGGSGIARLGLEFLILTACRTSEVIKARWDEFDLDEASWLIPAERMKARKPHRVPLSPRAVEIIRQLSQQRLGEYVFPGTKPGSHLSNMALLQLMKRMSETAVPHGFRSTFRDWASETTSFPHDVCEMALAHTIGNKAEAAYRRGDLFEKRRELMEAWASQVLVNRSRG